MIFGLAFVALIHLAVHQNQFGSSYEFIVSLLSDDQAFKTTFEWMIFVEATLPRWTMAIAVGGMLGLVGSLFQQLTQNRLMSPLTLGTSSGAWLGLVLLAVVFPSLSSEWQTPFALSGALIAMALVIAIVGLRNLTGLPVILAGMAVNLLLGAIATAIILLNDQYANNLFIWGAGDLAQNGWEQVTWLLPKLSISLLLVAFAPRVLTILSLGAEGAQGRGLNLGLAFFTLTILGVWLVATSITVVGVISFIGLIAPNMVRMMSYQKSRSELIASLCFGAMLLLAADTIAIYIGQWSLDIIPTGTATAIIGAPALIFIARQTFTADVSLSLKLPSGPNTLSRLTPLLLTAMLATVVLMTLLIHPTDGFAFRLPDHFEWTLQWPRLITAIAAGAGLSIAGVILQRLVYNPLASPDILGVSAGAVLALIGTSLILGISIHEVPTWVAVLGSLVTLAILLVLGRKHNFAPSMVVLTGVALTASLEALVQFSLTRVGSDKYVLIGWLSGSTYRVEPNQAWAILIIIALCVAVALVLSRWLTLIATGREFARARGIPLTFSYTILLTLVAILCSVVTTTMGPVAFVGLLAPHISVMLGARNAQKQLAIAPFIGAVLVCSADLLGQWMVYPAQIAAGTIVSVIGGLYFIWLLIQSRTSV
ncbi:Fe(3+)-hydroxamate ABC transporter permease FhuB [Vibrio agarivorans]|uniref:Fe(3+)-hydroxamate ABC transporter permease FhuB n=1 Tax=Vibrio agarivorans TaxID=153622 RepID=A0ABT7Y614_9VIBR|nr:Fe(3+)-hydroxamate ABC transporter permease FhuB [Vibrio agarivorans]MDN2483492.1 Fe(3+)-hydroxamate ABC transporter permease FhuB [Vibrio agarivorans]